MNIFEGFEESDPKETASKLGIKKDSIEKKIKESTQETLEDRYFGITENQVYSPESWYKIYSAGQVEMELNEGIRVLVGNVVRKVAKIIEIGNSSVTLQFADKEEEITMVEFISGNRYAYREDIEEIEGQKGVKPMLSQYGVESDFLAESFLNHPGSYAYWMEIPDNYILQQGDRLRTNDMGKRECKIVIYADANIVETISSLGEKERMSFADLAKNHKYFKRDYVANCYKKDCASDTISSISKNINDFNSIKQGIQLVDNKNIRWYVIEKTMQKAHPLNEDDEDKVIIELWNEREDWRNEEYNEEFRKKYSIWMTS